MLIRITQTSSSEMKDFFSDHICFSYQTCISLLCFVDPHGNRSDNAVLVPMATAKLSDNALSVTMAIAKLSDSNVRLAIHIMTNSNTNLLT